MLERMYMNNMGEYTPSRQDRLQTPTPEVDFGVAESELPYTEAFGRPIESLLKEGKEDKYGVQHYQLTSDGRKAAQNIFQKFEEENEGNSVLERAKSINALNFEQYGLNDQQGETIRRSLRAQLLVETAREFRQGEDKSLWKTVERIKREACSTEGKKDVSAFEALDRALEKATEKTQEQIQEQIAEVFEPTGVVTQAVVEETERAQSGWNRFIDRIRGREKPAQITGGKGKKESRRHFIAKRLTPAGLLAGLALTLRGSSAPIVKGALETAVETAEKAAESKPAHAPKEPVAEGKTPTPTAVAEKKPAEPPIPKKTTRRQLFRQIGEMLKPPTIVDKSQDPQALSEQEQLRKELEELKKQQATAIEEELPPLNFTHILCLPNTPLTLEGSWFTKPVEVITRTKQDFEEPKGLADYHEVMVTGTKDLRLAREGLTTNIWIHSGDYGILRQHLPAQEILYEGVKTNSLTPGKILTVTSPESETPGPLHLAFVGVSESIPGSTYTTQWNKEVVELHAEKVADHLKKTYGPDNPLSKALDERGPETGKRRNLVGMTFCDPDTREGKNWPNRTIGIFVVWPDGNDVVLTEVGPKTQIARETESTLPSQQEVLAEEGDTISIQGLRQETDIRLTDVKKFFAAKTLGEFQQGALVGDRIDARPSGKITNLLLHSDYYDGQPLNGQVVIDSPLKPEDKVQLANLTRYQSNQTGAGPVNLSFLWKSEPFARERYNQETWPTSTTEDILVEASQNLPDNHPLNQALRGNANMVACLTCDRKTKQGRKYPNIILSAFAVSS